MRSFLSKCVQLSTTIYVEMLQQILQKEKFNLIKILTKNLNIGSPGLFRFLYELFINENLILTHALQYKQMLT